MTPIPQYRRRCWKEPWISDSGRKQLVRFGREIDAGLASQGLSRSAAARIAGPGSGAGAVETWHKTITARRPAPPDDRTVVIMCLIAQIDPVPWMETFEYDPSIIKEIQEGIDLNRPVDVAELERLQRQSERLQRRLEAALRRVAELEARHPSDAVPRESSPVQKRKGEAPTKR